MAPTLDFATDNAHDWGICTGMSISWAKLCLWRGRAPKSKQEVGYGLSMVSQMGQRSYVGQGLDQLFAKKNLVVQREKWRSASWKTKKSKRFTNAAREVVNTPGVYLICTSDHTMAAAHFASSGSLVYLEPNEGQYSFGTASEFPGWYYTHVVTLGYDLADSILYKLGQA